MSIVSVLCRPSDRSLNRSLNRNADGTAGGIERRYVTLRSIGMSLFTKKEEPAQENVESKAAQPTSGKGRPTPKRKDAQAQNLRPLVPKDRNASRKAAKARIRERENAEYDAMQSGDINHMPKSERLPWRIYIRDYVDARFNLGEFFIPVAFIILIGSMVVTYKWPALALPLMLIMYVYLFAVIIDVAVMWHKLKKKLIEKFGEQSVAKGMRSGSYAWSRAIQIRRWSFRSLVTRSVDTGRSDRYREPPVIFQAVSEQLTAFPLPWKTIARIEQKLTSRACKRINEERIGIQYGSTAFRHRYHRSWPRRLLYGTACCGARQIGGVDRT